MSYDSSSEDEDEFGASVGFEKSKNLNLRSKFLNQSINQNGAWPEAAVKALVWSPDDLGSNPG